MSKQKLMANAKLKICMFGQKRIPSREGGVEVVVEELATRMAQKADRHVGTGGIRIAYFILTVCGGCQAV